MEVFNKAKELLKRSAEFLKKTLEKAKEIWNKEILSKIKAIAGKVDRSFIKKIPIPEDWKKLDTWAMLFRRLIYIASFAWFMYLDHIVGSAHGNIQQEMKSYIGVVFGIIILTAYKAKDFLKLPYLIWAVVYFIARPFLIDWISETDTFLPRVEGIVWNIGIYGIIFIRMFYLYAIERVKPNMKWPFFAVWVLMMLGMVFSVNDDNWYLWFFLIFGCFYLTNYTQRQLNELFSGMVEGIILTFIILQVQACLYRPYDQLRYMGMYTNCNLNALSYVIAYLAVLGKWYLMKLKRRPFILMVPFVLLGGSLWALTMFTMCRSALIAMAIFTLLFVLFQFISRRKKRFLELATNIVLILLAIFFMFQPTYNVVRYLPAYTNQPLFFVTEDPTNRVQADETFDSEKYTEYDEMLEGVFGRISALKDLFGDAADKAVNMFIPTLQVSASENVTQGVSEEREITELEKELLREWSGRLQEYPLLTDPKDYGDPLKVRAAIYDFYWRHLDVDGHTIKDNEVWVSSTYVAGHAHNIWLQFAYNHGWIVGILFVVVIGLTIFSIIRGLICHRQGAYYYRTFIMSGVLVTILSFGMFELCWMYGQISLLLLFMAFRVMCHRDEPKNLNRRGNEDESEQKQLSSNTD